MAYDPLSAPAGAAKSGVCVAASPIELLRIRVALIEQINAAAEKAMWGREPEVAGMPPRLFAAGCYLAAYGYDEIVCQGERWFNVDFGAYRSFVHYADMIELGRQAIYEGRRAIAPLPPMEMAA
jgi:hypothetical protein